MQYQDEGLVISIRPHGESGAIVTAFTPTHGRVAGMVRLSNKNASKAHVQLGNTLRLDWRARLEDQLGFFTIEPIHIRTHDLMQSRLSLAILNAITELLMWFQERDPHPKLYAAACHALDSCADLAPAMQAYAYLNFERLLLDEIGMGLDLSTCAATGETENLAYISPKTGRAVSAEAGAPYADKLFPFPKCFGAMSIASPPELVDILDGLEITGHFLAKYHFEYLPKAKFEAREGCFAALKLLAV